MILHEFSLSSASYRVRIALNLKGLSYETRSYKLRAGEQRSAEYLAINPAGFVPTLEADGRVLTQSLAIIDWLDAAYPEPRLIPSDPDERARALSMALIIACDIHPLNNLRVLQYLEQDLDIGEAARNSWYATWVRSGFAALEAMLAEAPGTEFAVGNEPGLVDIFIVPQLYNARRFSVPLGDFPRLLDVAERAMVLEPFVAAAPT
jgi:maleylacetoacetate isomerase